MLRDTFGRTFPYIRLSITDVCNFKCGYCLPNGYMPDKSDNRKFLHLEEIKRLARVLSKLGVCKIRLTGGEPTVRKDFFEIIKILKTNFPNIKEPMKEDICYATTNRQMAVKNIAKNCDMFFVIGSRNSSNSVRLVEVAKKSGCQNSQLFHSESEIPFDQIQNLNTIGISSGASAPEILVEDFINDKLELRGTKKPLNKYETDFLENAKNKIKKLDIEPQYYDFQVSTQVDKLNPTLEELINVTQNTYPDQYAIDNSFSKASKSNSKINLPTSAFEKDIQERYVIPNALKNSINKSFGTLPTTQDEGYSPNRIWTTDRKSTRLNSSHVRTSRMPSSA